MRFGPETRWGLTLVLLAVIAITLYMLFPVLIYETCVDGSQGGGCIEQHVESAASIRFPSSYPSSVAYLAPAAITALCIWMLSRLWRKHHKA